MNIPRVVFHVLSRFPKCFIIRQRCFICWLHWFLILDDYLINSVIQSFCVTSQEYKITNVEFLSYMCSFIFVKICPKNKSEIWCAFRSLMQILTLKACSTERAHAKICVAGIGILVSAQERSLCWTRLWRSIHFDSWNVSLIRIYIKFLFPLCTCILISDTIFLCKKCFGLRQKSVDKSKKEPMWTICSSWSFCVINLK